MEVLKSGDALEKQVLEDARTKAARILAEAERECAAVREEWHRKTEAELGRIEAEKDARIRSVRQELESSLPLDFMRARLSYIQESVDRALREHFAALAPAALARVIGRMLRQIHAVFQDAAAVAYASGMPAHDVKRMVEENIPGIKVQDVKEMETATSADGVDTGVVLETTNRRVRFRGTVRELSAQLLEGNREELAAALLGRDV
jgi:V/A-type H+/Na+-transporting ATPase subunit E